MKINVYQCDICKIEHRGPEVVNVHISVNGTIYDIRYEICLGCRQKVESVLNPSSAIGDV